MRPTHLSRLIIDGFQHSLAKDSVVCPSPAVLTVLGLREIDTVGIPRADDEQPGLGVKTRRAVICRAAFVRRNRSEEHTSELQSRSDLVCRLLLEKKKETHIHK